MTADASQTVRIGREWTFRAVSGDNDPDLWLYQACFAQQGMGRKQMDKIFPYIAAEFLAAD
jgi:hypothetical protein